MKKFLLPAIALSVSLFALSLFAPSRAYAGKPPRPSAATTETYMVIKVTDENKADNKIEFKAIAKSQFKNEQKQANDDFKKKTKEWHDLKKTDPTAPAPKRIKIQKLQSDYETMEGAQKYVEKLKKDEEDKNNGDTKPAAETKK